MKRNDWKIILGSVVFTYLFYQQLPGINYLIFGIIIVLLSALNKPENFLKPSVLISALGTLLAGTFTYLYGTSLPIISFGIYLSMLTAFIFEPKSSLIIASFHGFISILLAVPKMIATFIKKKSSSNGQAIKLSKLALLFFPIIITLIFFFLYRIANPNFLEFTKAINFEWLSLPLVRFFILSLVFIYGLLSHQTIKYLEKKDLAKNDDIETRTESAHQEGFIGNKISIENEVFIGASLLIMLNILLAIVNGIDIVKLWPNQVLPENQESYSQYLHSGIQMLIASIILAVAIIMFFFRGYFNYMKNALWLKVLAYIWLAQNVILLVSSIIRNNMYVQDYGLSHKRIGVFIYLFLAIIGLVFTLIKIAKKKNNMFLFRKNAWAFYLVLLIATPVSWDLVVTNFNLNLAQKQDKTPDIHYLSGLSHTNLKLLLPFFDIAPQSLYIGNRLSTDSNHDLNEKITLFLQDMQHKKWQSNCVAKKQNYAALLKMNAENKIPSILLTSRQVTLEALTPLTNLKSLSVQQYASIEDWESLKSFKNLEVLNLSYNYYNPLETLPVLDNLKYLNLNNNYIYDIKKLSKFTKLEYLQIGYNDIKDFTPLYDLKNLKELLVDGMSEEDCVALQTKLPNTTITFIDNYNYSR